MEAEMKTQFLITFEKPMSQVASGGFGLWLDMVIRNSAEDDPESDHGRFTVGIREVDE